MLPCKHIEELGKEALVHVASHLVENQPVAQGTMFHIVSHLQFHSSRIQMKVLCDLLLQTVYRFVIFCLDKVSSDLPLDQLVSAKYSAEFQGATIHSDWKFLILIEKPGATAQVW